MTQLPSGMYRAGVSMLHRLDAAVKLICFFLLLAAVLFTDTLPGYVAMLIFAAALTYLAQLKAGEALAGVKRLKWLLILIILMNFLFACPEKAFFRWWIFAPSPEGLVIGLKVFVNLALILTLGNVLSCTTPPLGLCSALQTLMQPLKYIGLPASHIAFVITAALRFIPTLFQEADKIRQAQRARGLSFEKTGFLDRARAASPLVIPLIISSFKRAEELSMSVEARGYRMDGRGAVIKKIEPAADDWAALLVCAAVFALQVIIL